MSGVDGNLGKTGAVSSPEHWYERPWRKTPGGSRSMVSAALYFIVGIGAVITALSADDTTRRITWWAIAVVFLTLGGTLVATLRARGKS
jgi:hypothetical protein